MSPKDRITIAVCGEVNSGKSSIINALHRGVLPPGFWSVEQVPLVRLTLGAEKSDITVVDADGQVDTFASVDGIQAQSGITSVHISDADQPSFGPCDIIEFPALRDGHVSQIEIEQIAACDVLVWATIGSQAWRLSEKNILDAFRDRLPKHRILVVSRADKFRSDEDRQRLMNRLERETSAYFRDGVLIHAAPAAVAASHNDGEVWAQTGGKALAKLLAETADQIANDIGDQKANATNLSEMEHEPKLAAEIVTEPSEGARNMRTRPRRTGSSRRPRPRADVSAQSQPKSNPKLVKKKKTHNTAVEIPSESIDAVDQTLNKEAPAIELTPVEEIKDIATRLDGVLSVAMLDLETPEDITIVVGEQEHAETFAAVCLSSAHLLHATDACAALEAVHISMQEHQILYRIGDKETRLMLLACQSSKISAGVARNTFLRMSALHDTILVPAT